MTKLLKNPLKLPRNRVSRGFWPRAAKRETKSREVPRRIKFGRLFWKSIVAGKKLQEKLQEAVCCRFFQGSVELLKNVSSKSGLGSTWLVRCENENCPLQITNEAFSTTERIEQSRAFEINCSSVAGFPFLTFSCCVTIVVPSLVCINIDSFDVIIRYNLIAGNTPPKIFFLCFLEMKIRLSWGYVLNSKWATREPIWLKLSQLTVR